LSPYNILQIDNDYIEKFKRIVTAIRSHKYIRVTNHSFNGVIYESQKIIPYKLEYSSQFDSFSLSCYPLDAKRPVKMNLKNLSDVEIEEAIPDYESFISYFEQQLRETLEHEPIVIEIINKDDAYDRSVYLFSSYNTYCYDIGNDTLQMHIYYYRFQKEEIIRNILFLGHYIKVVSPTNIADKIIKIIQAAYSNYE
jgi:predicted DNA-binding transcriptional regulator YafY